MELLIWLAMGFICYVIAKDKHRNEIGWLIGGFFGGLIALIILICLPKLEKRDL